MQSQPKRQFTAAQRKARREYMLAYWERNPEKKHAQQRAYRKRNRDRINAEKRAWAAGESREGTRAAAAVSTTGA